MLNSLPQQADVFPPVDEALSYWKGLWENPCQHDVSILSHIRDNIQPIDPMESPVVIADLFGYACLELKIGRLLDRMVSMGFGLSKLHHCTTDCVPDVLSGKSNFDAQLMQGKTTLIMKNPKRGEMPSNFRPITCLPTIWKVFSFLVSEIIYRHLENANLLPPEQKGCRKNS